MRNIMDLHVQTLARMRGGVLYKDTPPIVNNLGLVTLRTIDDKRQFELEAGAYIVTFTETLPEDILHNMGVACISTQLNQSNLHSLGMHLEVSLVPWSGFLTVAYSSRIESKSVLGTFIWDIISDEQEINIVDL
jgi:hypothetical protein